MSHLRNPADCPLNDPHCNCSFGECQRLPPKPRIQKGGLRLYNPDGDRADEAHKEEGK